MSRIIVVGDLVTDVVVLAQGPLNSGSDTDARVSFAGGGAGANTASWLAEAGVDTRLIARVGDDDQGRARSAELRALGVAAHLAIDPDRPTGTIVVLVAPDGERTMLADRGANLALKPNDIDPALFEPGAHLHLSGYGLLHDGPRPAAQHAIDLARAAGMTISVDAASAAPLRAVGPENFLGWTAGADLLFANRAEAAVLSGADDPDDPRRAAEQLAQRYGAVVVKLGAGGAIAAHGTATTSCTAPPAAVIDTTGAGDAFAAGVLADRLRHGSTWDTALAAGAALAARCVGVPGARPSPYGR